jgi:hypothetical protein
LRQCKLISPSFRRAIPLAERTWGAQTPRPACLAPSPGISFADRFPRLCDVKRLRMVRFSLIGFEYVLTHFDMSSVDFPSGPWTGFFTYRGRARKWAMDLNLSFANGHMTGEGHDAVGFFIIAGAYDPSTNECYWTKTYVAAHDVFYKGFREGKGIWGNWEIGTRNRGGFYIWPKGAGEGEDEAEEAALDLPDEIVTVGPNR